MRTAGAVTRTKFGRVKIRSLSSGSGRGGGSPRPERFVSEDAERAAGCEMALDVERVLDGGVILINRPLVVTPKAVRLCRPSENVLDLLPPQRGEFIKEDGERVIDDHGQRVAMA
jgi:hypothetical protein